MQAYSPEDCGHIRAQQQRIRERMNLESHTGAGAILTFLVEEELAGRGGSLDARTVAAAALGDSGRGSLVRVLKGDLAGKLLRYYAGPGKLDGILIRLPERGYRPLVYGRRPLSAQQESLYFHTACLLQLWALAQAAECLDRLSAEVPEFAPVYGLWAELEMTRQQLGGGGMERAFLLATRALDLHPALSEAYLALGAYYSEHEDWKRAGEQFDLARQVGGEEALAHRFHIRHLVRRKRVGEAMEILEGACRRTRGENPAYRHDRNMVRKIAGLIELAMEDSLLLGESHPHFRRPGGSGDFGAC